ncbi:MAG: hypothetical protein ACOC3G_03895 [Phycisphaeraceae bacterium]
MFAHFAGIIPRGPNDPGIEPGDFESEHFGLKELQTRGWEDAAKWDTVLDEMEQTGRD